MRIGDLHDADAETEDPVVVAGQIAAEGGLLHGGVAQCPVREKQRHERSLRGIPAG
jgi:hypothetical protein